MGNQIEGKGRGQPPVLPEQPVSVTDATLGPISRARQEGRDFVVLNSEPGESGPLVPVYLRPDLVHLTSEIAHASPPAVVVDVVDVVDVAALEQTAQEQRRIRQRAYMREYNQRPDVKERKAAHARARYQTDPAYRERQKASQRQRYQTDETYREQLKAKQRDQAKGNSSAAARRRGRYQTDEAFREKEKARARENYRKKLQAADAETTSTTD